MIWSNVSLLTGVGLAKLFNLVNKIEDQSLLQEYNCSLIALNISSKIQNACRNILSTYSFGQAYMCIQYAQLNDLVDLF